MDKSFIVFVVLFMIFTDSVIGRNHSYCHHVEEKCLNHRDCCTQICDRPLFTLNKNCKEPMDFSSVVRYMLMPTVEDWMCLYKKSANRNISNQLNLKYGLNAAYNKLPPGTVVKVTYSDKTLFLTINNHLLSDSSEEVLHISEDVANEFGIEYEGIVPCVVVVPTLSKLKDSIKSLLFNLPFGFGRLVNGILWLMIKLQ